MQPFPILTLQSLKSHLAAHTSLAPSVVSYTPSPKVFHTPTYTEAPESHSQLVLPTGLISPCLNSTSDSPRQPQEGCPPPRTQSTFPYCAPALLIIRNPLALAALFLPTGLQPIRTVHPTGCKLTWSHTHMHTSTARTRPRPPSITQGSAPTP